MRFEVLAATEMSIDAPLLGCNATWNYAHRYQRFGQRLRLHLQVCNIGTSNYHGASNGHHQAEEYYNSVVVVTQLEETCPDWLRYFLMRTNRSHVATDTKD
jgi:hypothetical protein